ncbi:TRAP transporter permease [Virgibacillus salexigens]|uniref:C4-dicarboxylate ABC transporter n=1 Tax=Virgibacillus kapii TaxID=1638645 RepID=A0ABQ2DTG8_9BACI|nr:MULTISPECIES: TRAP transporter permease [Virgibacillus]MYL40725.1 TRAP transporter fused permease subunit [Virgibacillus massiliensis]GGJ72613.1 C4-dicarboxylate ABC transporter [Virgibacillus kapii]
MTGQNKSDVPIQGDQEEEAIQNEKVRLLKGYSSMIISIAAITMSLFHLYTGLFGVFESILQRAAHLGFALILVFAIYKPSRKAAKNQSIPWFEWIFIALSIVSYSYFVMHAQEIQSRMSYIEQLTPLEMALGFIACLSLIEATRRVIGNTLVILILVCLVYGFWGHLITGELGHREFTPMWIIDHLFYTVSGVFGTPLGVSATFIFLFILFGKFLEVSGAGNFFINLSVAGMGKYRGGPAKTAIVASSILGTISGSAVANTATTGAFTIPLMKKTGYKKQFAGAVEAVSSTGGQIMPPIMGASAFIIAAYLGIPYMELAVAAIIPAVLYYLSLFIQVDLRAKRNGLHGIQDGRLPKTWDIFKRGFHFLIPLVVIVVLLIGGSSPMKAGLYAIIATILVAAIRTASRLSIKQIVKALDLGAKASLETVIACASAGLIIGIISLTGIGLKFSSIIIDLSGGVLILALVFTMITSIILGMGLPTVAAYIVQVPLTIPALVELGVAPIAAHLFVFYFAALSAITPPVALAAFAAAGISGSEPMKTGLTAMRLGIAAYIVPYLFVYGEQLLLIGGISQIILSIATAVIGVIGIASGAEGWLLRHAYWYERVILFAGSLLMIFPGIYTDIVGVITLLFVYLLQKSVRKDAQVEQPSQLKEM